MITRVYCSRSKSPHPLGDISADVDGLMLTYREAVITTPNDPAAVRSPHDNYHYRRNGAEARLRPPTDEVVKIDLWCASCKTGHPVDARVLFDAARKRQRNVTLTSRGAWEGIWPKD